MMLVLTGCQSMDMPEPGRVGRWDELHGIIIIIRGIVMLGNQRQPKMDVSTERFHLGPAGGNAFRVEKGEK